MPKMTLRSIVFSGAAFVAVVAGAAVAPLPAFAQSAGQPPAAGAPGEPVVVSCFVPPAKLPDQDVQAFLANPRELLRSYANGGLALSSRVRALAGSSSLTLPRLLSLMSAPAADEPQLTASPDQIAAIGAGLGRAARSCVGVDAEYAARIQQEIALLNNQALTTAFLSGNSDVATAALGGGAGAGGGAAAGAGIGGGGAGTAAGTTAGGTTGGDSSTVTTSGSFPLTFGSRYFASSGGGGSSTTSVSPAAIP